MTYENPSHTDALFAALVGKKLAAVGIFKYSIVLILQDIPHSGSFTRIYIHNPCTAVLRTEIPGGRVFFNEVLIFDCEQTTVLKAEGCLGSTFVLHLASRHIITVDLSRNTPISPFSMEIVYPDSHVILL